MANIPFPTTTDGSEDLPRGKTTLQNCWVNEKGEVIYRPGITKLSTTLGPARGGFEWNGSLYNISGNSLIKITNILTGAFSTIGTIAGSANIKFAIGFNDAVIVVKGGALYTLSKVDLLTDISGNSNFVACVDLAHINGRFVYIPADGDPAFFSDVGAAGTVQAASFFDAEELPDLNRGVINFKNTLYILGENSIELFRDVGTFPNPFARINGARIDFGYIGGLLEYQSTFIFIGKEKGQDFGIYAIAPGNAQKISNPRIDLILTNHTFDEMADVITGRIKWRGYDLFTFSLRANSFALFGTKWFLLDTVFDGISRPWGGGFITEFSTKYYAAFNDNFGRFDKVNKDYGNPITRLIEFGFKHPEADRFGVASLELGISNGFNAVAGSVAIRMSRDNVQYGPPVYRNTSAIGKYADKLVWNPPGGLGNYIRFAGVQLYTTQDIIFSADQMVVKFK